MPIRNEIKILLAKENLTMTELSKKLTEKGFSNFTLPSISKKLTRGTLTFNETEIFADILGYDIIFKKR